MEYLYSITKFVLFWPALFQLKAEGGGTTFGYPVPSPGDYSKLGEAGMYGAQDYARWFIMKRRRDKPSWTLTMFRKSLILKPSGCLVLVRTIQSYLAPWAAKGSTIPLCRLAKFRILFEMKIHAHIYSCMAILCTLFVWQFLTLKINLTVVKDQNFQFQNSYINSMGSHGQHTPHHLPTSY